MLIILQGPKPDETKKLTIHHVSGVFLILFAGCIYGIFEGLLRWFLNMRRHSKALNVSIIFDIDDFYFYCYFCRFHSWKFLKKNSHSFGGLRDIKNRSAGKVYHR